jgi:hypothetical protein
VCKTIKTRIGHELALCRTDAGIVSASESAARRQDSGLALSHGACAHKSGMEVSSFRSWRELFVGFKQAGRSEAAAGEIPRRTSLNLRIAGMNILLG